MKPNQLHLFRAYGRPALTATGEMVAALTAPDVDDDCYSGKLQLLRAGLPPTDFTHGPRDSAPVLSPNGSMIVFLRAGEHGPAQLWAIPLAGGEPLALADHPLGVSAVTFAPDGRAVAYLAAVPEPGRYGTSLDEEASPSESSESKTSAPEAEAPRRITQLSYRLDGKGFLCDKLEQIFVLDLLDEAGEPLRDSIPRQLTSENVPVGRPAFTPDGRDIVYERAAAIDSQQGEIAAVAVSSAAPTQGRSLVAPAGDASHPVVSGNTLFYLGAAFDGQDFAGRTTGLWAVPLSGGVPRRITDERTVDIDPGAGDPVVVNDVVLVPVADRGAVSLRAVPVSGTDCALADLPVVIAGQREVRSFTVTGKTVAAVVADAGSCGDIVIVKIPTGRVGTKKSGRGVDPVDIRRTDVSAPLRKAGLGRVVELNASASDGYPVHGWLVLPPGAGPHPVLLDVHGGPHTQYTWRIFDEAHMYASNGYAVVLPNPRGSAGYGLDHGRCLIGELGTVDVDDVLSLLDEALAHDDVDSSRVGVMGGSYGGFMTSWLASHAPGRFVAGISERAVNAWDSFAGSSDIGYFFVDAYVGSDPAEQRRRSPLTYAADVDIPLLIIHSEQDWRCPLEQAQRLFVALKKRGHETEMLIFPGEGHELSRSGRPKHRQQRFEAILDWWTRYLPLT